jgi:hypothetical protein
LTPLIKNDHFLALQMVNFSSLHDEGRPDDALHQFHSIELVIALRMVVSWWILDFIIEVCRLGGCSGKSKPPGPL